MEYLILILILFLLELLYFKVADKFNIIDKPNMRSSHKDITLRGGGIIFYFAAFAFFMMSGFMYPWFFLGLSAMAFVSFLDDVYTLSNKLRLVVHFFAVVCLLYQLNPYELSWYSLVLLFIVVVGILNAYNFMDGINGITASYSISLAVLLLMVNTNNYFVDQRLIIYSIIALLVFGFYNFRQNAKTFAGDVGSVSIAFILVFCLGLLLMESGKLIYCLFLSVYGIDVIWTILRRLHRKENIFEAHRSHLYQFLANEANINKLYVAALYGLLQLLIGLAVIWFANKSMLTQILFSASLLTGLSIIYLLVKKRVIDKYIVEI